MANMVSGGIYAGNNIMALMSHPELDEQEKKKSETITSAERHAARALMDKSPNLRAGMPMAQTIVPIIRYLELHGQFRHYSSQFARDACALQTRLGRRCTRVDYAPFAATMTFKLCSERTSVDVGFVFIADPVVIDNHFEQWPAVKIARANGERSGEFTLPPPSIELKRYFKEGSTIPSPEKKLRLASTLLSDSSDKGIACIDHWFAAKRLDELLKASERATAAKELAERGARDGDPEPVIERLIELCRSQIPALSGGNPSLRKKCIELLRSDKMGATMSIQGDTSELVKRVFSNIDFAI